MDNSKINQTELLYNSSCGKSKVNLYTGRVLFEHFDAEIGINTYNVSVSHLYNSQLELPNNINTFMGKKWKLNVQQYVYNREDKYFYIDSSGLTITFEFLVDNIYYDNSGLGLRMYIYDTYIKIKDLSENIMIFENNKLVKTISAENLNIEKNFVYDNDKLIKIYDSRKPDCIIQFDYNDKDLIEKISVYKNNKIQYFNNYFYDNDNQLCYISKTINSMTKDLTLFSYYNDYLTYAVSLEDRLGMRFIYKNDKIKELRIGSTLVGELVNGDFKSYIGIDNYIHISTILSDNNINQKYYVRPSIIKLDNDLITLNKFEYNGYNTIVSNEHNIKMIYYLNEEGYTTSILESKNSDNTDLRSLKKMPGIDIKFSGGYVFGSNAVEDCPETINGHRVLNLTSNVSLVQENDSIEAVDNYRSQVCPNYINYTLSFWLKIFNNYNDNRIELNVKSKEGWSSKEYKNVIYFDDTAINSWQEIRIPIKIEKSNVKRLELLFLENDVSKHVKICDMKLYYDTTSRVGIGYNNVRNYLDEITKIEYYVKNANELLDIKTINLNKNTFITEKDLQLTYINRFKLYGTSNVIAPFPLYYNDSTKQIMVYKVSLITNDNIKYDLDFIEDEYTFDDIYFDVNHDIPKKANFYLEVRTPDGDSYTQNIPYFTKYKTEDKNVLTISQNIKGNKYAEKDENGNIVKKHEESSKINTTDLLGKLLYEKNEYGNVVTYSYDTYGQLSKKKIINSEATDDDSEILYIYNNTESSEKVKDEILTIDRNYDEVTGNIINSNTYGTKENSINGYSKNYIYDGFNEKLKYVGDNISSNYIEYDERGRVSVISPKNINSDSFYGFKFGYNTIGDLNNFNYLYKQNGSFIEKTLITKSFDRLNGIVKTEKNINNNETFVSYTYLDEYGDIKKIFGQEIKYVHNGGSFISENVVTVNKDKLDESPGAAKVSSIVDEFENRTYTYNYDRMYDLKKVTIESPYVDLEIEKSNHDTINYLIKYIYNDDGDKFKIECFSIIEKDENILLEPRVFNSYNSLYGGHLSNKTMYEYDGYGRIKKKKLYFNPSFDDIRLEEERHFKNNSNQVNNINVNLKSSCDLASCNLKYEYDHRGNETKNEIIIDKKYPTEAQIVNLTYDYQYNNAFQLKKEINNFGTKGSVTKEYSYNDDGSINYVKILDENNNNYNINYTYNNGMLTNITNEYTNQSLNISTDNFGNIINVGERVYNWTRGNLLSEYCSEGKITKYFYNGFEKKYRKVLNNGIIVEYIYDKDKLVTELHINNKGIVYKHLNYMYDLEEIIGFELGPDGDRFYFIKDKNRNVIGIINNEKVIATYGYDAYGNCSILYKDTFEDNTDNVDIAELNPIRWKSLYCETESNLYIINQNVYSPELRQNLSMNLIENTFERVNLLNSLYPYQLSNTTPLNLITVNENLLSGHKLVHESSVLPKWQIRWNRLWNSWPGAVLAVSLTVIAFIIPCSKLLSGLVLAGVALSLAAGATFAGIRNYSYGKGFWNGFLQYINNEWAKEVTIEMLCFLVIGAFTDGFTECFIAGTLVLTSLGLKKIEEIKIGDKVWSYNEKTKKKELKKVKNIFRNKTNKWLHLIIKNNKKEEEIICTPNHRIYIKGKGWIKANEILENDEVLLYNNIVGKVIKKELQYLEKEEATYNFEVEDNHNYYVSKESILVHNDCLEIPPDEITGYTKHGLQQVMGRENHGVSLKGILDAWQNPKKIIYDSVKDTFKYFGEKSIVVLNRKGKIVTAIAKSSIYWRY